MKATSLLCYMLLFSFSLSWGQVDIHRIKNALENGIFARNMNLQYIRSLDKHDKKPYPNADSLTAYFFRFYNLEWVANSQCYVGKVFLSERYLKRDFVAKFKNSDSFKTDKEGFYMMCKLYVYEQKFIYINIYPDYITNIYDKSLCKEMNITFSGKYPTSDEYFVGLKSFVLKKDILNTDLFAVAKDWNNTTKKKQFKKFIKCFKVDISPSDSSVVGLTKKYTKYAFSDDRIEDPVYELDYKAYKNIPNDNAALLAFVEPWECSDIGPSDVPPPDDLINLVEQSSRQGIYIKSFSKERLDTTYKLVEKSNKPFFWVYAGVLQKDSLSMADTTKCIVCIPNDKIISLKNGGFGFTVSPRTDANLRTDKPIPFNDTWKKAPIAAVAKGLDGKNPVDILIVKDKAYIPSLDGRPLLWLKVEKQQ